MLKFFQQAFLWYKKGTISRALSSLSKPYQLHYKDTVLKIEYYTKAADYMSTSASRAELRDMHLKLNDLAGKFSELLQVSLSELVPGSPSTFQLSAQAKKRLATQSLSQSIHHGLDEQKKMIYDLQLSNIVNTIVVNHQPEHVLQLCKTVLNRRRRRRPDLTNYPQQTYQDLNTWANCNSSSLLIVQPGRGAKAKVQGLATTIIENLRFKNRLVLWSLSTGSTIDEAPTLVSLLKELTYQALRLAVSETYNVPPSLSASSFQVAHTEGEWVSLLSLLLSCNQETFIVLEIEAFPQSYRKNQQSTPEFLGLFQKMVESIGGNSCIKALIINHSVSVANPVAQGSRPAILVVESAMLTGKRVAPRCSGRGRGRGRARLRVDGDILL
jgi:hypothetical protein